MLQPEDDEIVGETELLDADYLRVWSSVPFFQRMAHSLLLLPVVFLATIALTYLNGGEPTLTQLLPSLALAGFMLGVRWYWPRAWARNAVKYWRGERVTFQFGDDGFRCSSPSRDARLAWSAVPQVRDAPSGLLVYTGEQTVVVVPERAFRSADWLNVRRLCQERAPQKPESKARKTYLWWLLASRSSWCSTFGAS